MSHKLLPKITISASDRRHLQRLASTARGDAHPVAYFLAQELARAEIVPDDSNELELVVTMGSSVRYALNWGSLVAARKLVYPEEYAPDRCQVSVLSPLGAALIGLRVGSRMPYSSGGWLHVVRVEDVSRSGSNVVRLPLPPRQALAGGAPPNDSGPSAA
jgi:regulator of nucleoside diphosphate kinase